MNKIDLAIYEMPEWFSYISWNWAQELAGKYIAWIVNRKYARYLRRITPTNKE